MSSRIAIVVLMQQTLRLVQALRSQICRMEAEAAESKRQHDHERDAARGAADEASQVRWKG